MRRLSKLLSALVVLTSVVAGGLALPGCKKQEPPQAPQAQEGALRPFVRVPGEEPPPLHPPAEDDTEGLVEGRADLHSADAMRAETDLGVKVDAALVERFVAYRRLVVQKSRGAVDKYSREARADQPANRSSAARAARATEEFAVRMRAIEDAARQETKLSRDEVGAAARVAGAVLSQRQIWKLSGGDAALTQALAQIETMTEPDRTRARQALEASSTGFAQMKEARDARRLYGDAAVDAVLAHEDALWELQQQGMGVMAQVY